MPQRDYLAALNLGIPKASELTEEAQALFNYCDELLGFIPNMLKAFSHNTEQFGPFSSLYTALMKGRKNVRPIIFNALQKRFV